jgi:hypothetical protein
MLVGATHIARLAQAPPMHPWVLYMHNHYLFVFCLAKYEIASKLTL